MVVPLLAVMVAVSPVVPPEVLSVGVVSLVTLSVLDAPVSEDGSKSGAVGAEGPLPPDDDGALLNGASITKLNGELLADVLPAGSVNVAVVFHVPPDIVGRSHDVAVPTV